jgi:hypothetical protein
MSVFGTYLCADEPCVETLNTAEAALQVTEKGMALSEACKLYKVDERNVISFIIEKTEYDTTMDIIDQNKKEKLGEDFYPLP